MTTTTTTSPLAGTLDARLAALFALAFGAAIIFAAGFAHSQTLHNAAHDYRHAMAFPCH